MHIYTPGQWALLFFFYCLCGWVWESCYVSLRQRRWVNRGFLHGPLLPIYGTGAILILFVTLPAAEHWYLVFLLGTAAATALECVTGAAMEALFKVRYWDYSHQRFNLGGYICLTSSVAWGFFSILLVDVLHPPVGRLLSRVPGLVVNPLALALAILFAADVVQSVRAALDLRQVLSRLTEENEDLRRLARRAEVAAAFAGEDLRRFRERTALEGLLLQERIEAGLRQKRQRRARRAQARQEALEDALCRGAAARLEVLHTISEALEAARDRLGETVDLAEEALAERRAELSEAIDRVRRREDAVRARSARAYRRALRILRANPSATAKGFAEALESLKELGGRK